MDSLSFYYILSRWYALHARDLPWRHTLDPYRIWLSEIILQQTRISQGMDYWQRFVTRWPTVETLAEASEDEVLKAWQGLGYYSRARNLHFAAKQITALGHFPDTLREIRRLKGVGDYTAAAIASFAFGIRAAAVDGNFYRVLARIYGIDTPIDTTLGKKTFAALADSLIRNVPDKVPSPLGGTMSGASLFNQAMMDFGATQCTPQSPHCRDCPFAEECVAYREDLITALPVKKGKDEGGHTSPYLYIHPLPRLYGYPAAGCRDIWQGLWEPPVFEDEPLPAWEGRLTLLASGVKHVPTHRILLADFYCLDTDERPALSDDYLWIAEGELKHYAVSRLVERLLQTLS